MSKLTAIYACSHCGAQTPKWSGRCFSCGQWGTLAPQTIDAAQTAPQVKAVPAQLIDLSDITDTSLTRLPSGLNEFDRVLGAGFVPGSLVLLGGEPGIGKSTLALQVARSISGLVIYVSGEESAPQVKARLDRLGGQTGNLKFIAQTDIDKIISALETAKPALVIIDSIQTMYTPDVPAESGSVSQIRACGAKLLQIAKNQGIAILITGHITKDGTLAGPKTLEHLVDTVLYLEQQKSQDFRVLRAVKNRFGSTDEIGLFTMSGRGFAEIKNPSGIFLDEQGSAIAPPGTAVGCIIEGTRPFLVEVQALVTKTVFGYPQRKSSGIDLNRLQIMLAVLTKRAGLNVATQDVHINIVGGLMVKETALDAAVCAAIISSATNLALDKRTAVLGEVGLGGELRGVHKLEQRLQEAAQLGFTQALIPPTKLMSKLTLVPIATVGELVKYITGK